MAKKPETKNLTLSVGPGTFTSLFRRLRGDKKGYNFSEISAIRQLLSNERARLLHTIKEKNPESMYQLAKLLGRDFKSVRQDIKLLEKFGFIELDATTKGKREMLKPILAIDSLNITIQL